MLKYVPKDTGALRETVVKGTDYIKYNVLYAHAQYVGD